jgi:hypothetical protein
MGHRHHPQWPEETRQGDPANDPIDLQCHHPRNARAPSPDLMVFGDDRRENRRNPEARRR